MMLTVRSGESALASLSASGWKTKNPAEAGDSYCCKEQVAWGRVQVQRVISETF